MAQWVFNAVTSMPLKSEMWLSSSAKLGPQRLIEGQAPGGGRSALRASASPSRSWLGQITLAKAGDSAEKGNSAENRVNAALYEEVVRSGSKEKAGN